MKKVRVGVVGVGHIGSNHARLYSEMGTADLSAVYDVDLARAQAIAEKYGATAAKSLDEFTEFVDAASVAAPTSAHYEIALPLLQRGKHLLIEKPITENTAHASELADLATTNHLVLQVGHVERFNPVLGALESRLTHPRFIEAHRLSPYPDRSTDIGVVLDLMIHDFAFGPVARAKHRRRRRAGVEPGRRYRQCPDSIRKRLRRKRNFEPDQSRADAQDPRLSGGCLPFARLRKTIGRNLSPRSDKDHTRQSGDRARRTVAARACIVHRMHRNWWRAACFRLSGGRGSRARSRDHQENDEARMTNVEGIAKQAKYKTPFRPVAISVLRYWDLVRRSSLRIRRFIE